MSALAPPLKRVGCPILGLSQQAVGRGALARVRAHPDLLCVTLVLALALFFRGQFVFRAPPFLQHDSIGYFQPAYDLLTGQGFGVGFRRTPVYPLFLTGVLFGFGQSLTAVMLVQHLFGAIVVGLTFALGRLTFGRLTGLLAGLMTAVNGALIIGEHYLMTESLFLPLLLATLLALIKTARSPSSARYLGVGLLLALTTLCRPITQALYPLVPLALLLVGQPWRAAGRGTALVGLGVLALTVPWTARNCLSGAECSTTGAAGQAMLARTAYYDKGFIFFDQNDPERGLDAPRPAIRRSIQRAAEQGFSGGVIARRLQAEFKWSDAETARITREMALEVIRRQPAYYLSGTLKIFGQIAGGEFERLRTDWKTQSRRLNRDEWDDRIEPLLAAPTPQQEAEFPRAEALVDFWQPVYWQPWLPVLALVGTGLAVPGRGSVRGAVVLGLAALILMLVAAALDGPVARYRYPADPIMAVLAAGAAVVLARAPLDTARRWADRGVVPNNRLPLGKT